jgi:transaldolase / glucose-6-phosphate isomerase
MPILRAAGPLGDAVGERLAAWERERGTARLWAKDASLWTGGDEARWLGWLDAAWHQRAALGTYRALQSDVRGSVTDVVVLGMGGSSLCPHVLASSCGVQPGWPELRVLDSTDPVQIATLESRLDLARTLFIVASKSGSTLEPNLMRDYFLDRVRDPSRFIAITDPGSQLERQAAADGFRTIVRGEPEIGGRFSALSPFGMVPAAAMGLNVEVLLARAEAVAQACRVEAPAGDNPGVVLGVTLGVAAHQGRDKLTIVASPGIAELGAWLEQLVAESTGKQGKGIVPVDREPLAAPDTYGDDRIFAYLRLEEAPDPEQDRMVESLEHAGHPVVHLALRDRSDLAMQFFLWEFATAVAGAVLRINPFDQPDVEAAKVEARRLMAEVDRTGALPPEAVLRPGEALVPVLRALFARIAAGDYVALLAYLPMTDATIAALQHVRVMVHHARRVATTVGFGPRFLHSTGQLHKGGPDRGVFLQLTADPARDLPVPGRGYTFGTVEAAQARGDAAVLAARGRRMVRVHLGADLDRDLAALDAAVRAAL